MSLSSPCLPVVMPPTPTRADPPITPSKQGHAEEQTTGTALRLFMVIAVYAIPIVVSLRPVAYPIVDPDIWWHLRVGQWIVEHDSVPVTDPFSRYGLDKPWIAYSWLYEVLVFRLHEMFGLAGIVAYRVVLAVAVVAALHRLIGRREPRFLVATGLTAVTALAVAPLLSERPWLFTILFTILTVDVLLDLRAGRATRLVWLLPIVYALWANVHIQFVYGLFLLGLACVAPLIDALLGRWRDDCGGPTLSWRIVLLTGLCALATLVNPYHEQLYRVVLEYATQPGPFRCVNELRALEFREMCDWVMLVLGAWAVFALGKRQRLSSFETLLLVSAGIFAFRSRRDLWFLVLAAVAILATQNIRPIVASARFVLTPRRWALVTVALAGLIVLIAWKRNLSAENLQQKVAGVFPVEAVAAIAEHGYEGPLYNDFNWGGFLIWNLPQLPVALDGRTNLHGDERILRIGNTWAAGPGWRDDPDLATAGVILADVQSPLGCVLILDDRFQLVYEDPIARVFIRAPLHARSR
ncbi:MAG TPA: hypothetical protein VN688_15065 [Gemmataceae bacterium]|nr:hypothetical protein [Gemmataceae bacterium]